MDNSSRLYGATGFVDRLIAAYLAKHAPAGLRVGLAGRARARLEAVRTQLPVAAHGWALIEADTEDRDSIAVRTSRSNRWFPGRQWKSSKALSLLRP